MGPDAMSNSCTVFKKSEVQSHVVLTFNLFNRWELYAHLHLSLTNAFYLLIYTTEDVTRGKHYNSGDCCRLNVTVRADKVPFKKAWKTLTTSGSKLISIKSGKKAIPVFYARPNLQAIHNRLEQSLRLCIVMIRSKTCIQKNEALHRVLNVY